MPPTDILLNKLMGDFQLLKAGVNSSVGIIKFELQTFICDAKACAALNNIYSHAAYNSCERCIQVGQKIDIVIVSNNLHAEARNDTSFSERQDEAHHKSNEKNIFFFVLDIMHLCYLLCIS